MKSKVLELSQAVELVPPDGARLAFGGLTMYRRPLAFSLALLVHGRQNARPRGLQLLSFTAGLESDLLVGEAMIETVRTCYFGLEVFGLAPHFSRAASEGALRIIEESESSLASGLRAAMAGVGFMPALAWLGTDLPSLRPDVKTVTDPYSGEELIAFPALELDVAVIHALEADEQGNATIGGNVGVDPELALVADTVIVTTEQIRPALRAADIVAPLVDAVVLAEGGAWPTSCHPLYPMEGEAVLEYIETAGTAGYEEMIAGWLEHHGLAASH